MTDYMYRVYEYIVQATSSELILFAVLAAIFFSTGGVVFYKLGTNRRKQDKQFESDKQDKYIEREREIIAVIKENSATIAANTAATSSLKLFLESTSADTKVSLTRIHERLDLVLLDTAKIKTLIGMKTERGGEQ